MSQLLESYIPYAGSDVIEQLQQLSKPLKGIKILHVNSTMQGGGVAEILHKLVPLMNELGLDTQWEVIQGNPDFYMCTKCFHNAIQGNRVSIPQRLLTVYEEINAVNARRLEDQLRDTDVVIIHDPQPAAMLSHIPQRRGKWVWRCHIDANRPFRPVWKYLRNFINQYDASIFSLAAFAQKMAPPVYLIAPSIDPLNEKNIELDDAEIAKVCTEFDLDPARPLLVQVSRFDRFKDPIGVIQAHRSAKHFFPSLQLVLAGGSADDDPEGTAFLEEVMVAAEDDPDIHVLLLPPNAHRTINALQRTATIVLQKSVREGFGLTVTEALWKQKPVIGGDTGGIRIQVINHHTGFLVNSPEGAALRIRHLLSNQDLMREMGVKARQFVRDNFLITRHIREYLTLIYALVFNKHDRIELS